MMKRNLHSFALVALIMLPGALAAADRTAQWQAVTQAVTNGLPRTAIDRLVPLIEAAKREQAWAEATRAIAQKIILEARIEGGKPEAGITRMQAELSVAPAEMKPVMEVLLAEWYWRYFQGNRWRFVQRTQTAETPGDDFTTWDLPRILAEIDRHFAAALQGGERLKRMPIAAWNDLLEAGDHPDTYRPTLYDFVAQEALSFYQAGEQAVRRAEDEFELTPEMPALGTVDEFLGWNLPGTSGAGPNAEPMSPTVRALAIHQDLLRFHRNDPDRTAFLNADLERLAFALNVAGGEAKHARFKTAVERLIADGADNEVSAQARWYLARLVKEQDNDWVAARKIAQAAVNAFPDSIGGRKCHNLIAEIEARQVRITTERVWNAPWPQIEINYRNLTNVWFRAVEYDWDLFLQRDRTRPENLNQAGRRELLAKAPALEWSASLAPTTDFKEARTALPAPTTLKPGFYLIVASHSPQFTGDDNVISYAPVWVSELALITRSRAGVLEGFVLEAQTGEPVAGATVEGWYLDSHGDRVAVAAVKTDANGTFVFKDRPNRGQLLVRAKSKGREIASEQDVWWNESPPSNRGRRTVFYTDRAIYRPGQTIQYKGICLQWDHERDRYEAGGARQVTVVFRDANRQEIGRQTRPVNDYGSFAGSFTSPNGRLTGQMSLAVESGPPGDTWVSIEEYKRPKFHVDLPKPAKSVRLGDTVTLTGTALAYTGAAIDGAKVHWRVVREVRFPGWWNLYRGGYWNRAESREIGHGIMTTTVSGTFEVSFVAEPDRSVVEADDPRFIYNIYADVTDATGETRSAQQTVTIGYTAMDLTVVADEWLPVTQAVSLRIKTATLDGQPVAATGTVKIYRLAEPATVQRPLISDFNAYRWGAPGGRKDPSDPNNWELGDGVLTQEFSTDGGGATTNSCRLGAGLYRAMVETKDRYGRTVTTPCAVQVIDPEAPTLAAKIPFLLRASKWSLEPGEEFTALWGTGYPGGRAFVEIERKNRIVESYWTRPGQTQERIRHAVEESWRGGFTLHVTMVHENRAYTEQRHVEVPWTNKELELSWEHFNSKLEAGQKETWTLVVKPRKPITEIRKPENWAAELVATLYDASLDALRGNHWDPLSGIFRQDGTTARVEFQNGVRWFQQILGGWRIDIVPVNETYRHIPYELSPQPGEAVFTRFYNGSRAAPVALSTMAGGGGGVAADIMGVELKPVIVTGSQIPTAELGGAQALSPIPGTAGSSGTSMDLSQVSARRNLNETAFFFPQLMSDSNGVVRLTFTLPEALTEWRFRGLAHDRELRSGYLEASAVTSKDIMVQPNPPRFVREGDVLEFTVKVSNQSAARQTGMVRLNFADARTGTSVDAGLQKGKVEQAFDIPAKESRTFSWRMDVPDGMGLLTYKALGSTGRLSDGEEGYLPVLSRRVLLSESLPLPIRGPGEKEFVLETLKNSAGSKTLIHQSLTVQMVSNPAWYAVLALPYLMEFPHECAEQTFNRLYANALAKRIADGNPKIRRVFDQWRDTPALDSPLEKNAELKSVLLEETPWVRQAESEGEARHRIGVLFDANRLTSEQTATLTKLSAMQYADGRWPWFPGGSPNDYITLYIVTGFGRLRHLGGDVGVDPALKALGRLDQWMADEYGRIQKQPAPRDYVPSPTICLYFYGRSFFLRDRPIAPAQKDAADFFLEQARSHWLKTGCRQSEGQLAIALKRFGDPDTAKAIMRSLKERSVTDDELGRFWRDTERSWWWYRAPIETQALMIEAFDEVAGDASAVEECKVWLLKQKQTQDWKTTKATADAAYSLLLRGADLLASDALVEVKLGGKVVPRELTQNRTPGHERNDQFEAGTGFYEARYQPADISAALANVTVKKTDPGVAWGSVHWQYLEDLAKIRPYTGTPLTLVKKLFTKVNTSKGPELRPVGGPLEVGDELVVRLELRVDRDMEYVHLKDERGSGTEPVNVLSGYRYQDGLRYYESTRDTASHFFIDYLPKGNYVFEYSSRVQLRGDYQTGMATIQCMYAPEFGSHSSSLPIAVK